ncbi:uncharacterized protein [Procambarus clarkii]|uniref:uncharacterized protein n=1 Tax=Procambarus clarkii TaxID=6728 RepID=UPI003744716C
MASKPEGEEASVHQDEGDLGYDKEQNKNFPCQNPNNFSSETLPPKYNFEIREKDFLDHAVKTSNVFPRAAWMEDYKMMKTGHVILLEGSKIIEKNKNIKAHHQEHIVGSPNYRNDVYLLINFYYKLGHKELSELKEYLHSMAEGSNESYIPNGLNKEYISIYIYHKGKNRESLKNIKHALQEFCRLVKDSEVSIKPYSATLVSPASFISKESSYASVVKNSQTKTKEIITKPVVTRNQQVIRSGSTSKCRENHVNAEKKSLVVENLNSDSKFSYDKSKQALNGNKILFGNEKKITSPVEPRLSGKGSQCDNKQVAETHKRRGANTTQRGNRNNSNRPVENSAKLPKKTNIFKSFRQEESGKFYKENKGNKYIRGCMGGFRGPMITALRQNYCSSEYLYQNQMCVRAVPHNRSLSSESMTDTFTSKEFSEGKNDIICSPKRFARNRLHTGKGLVYQEPSLGKSLDNFPSEKDKYNYVAVGEPGILLDTILAKTNETLSVPLTIHKSSSGDGAGMSCVNSSFHLTKQTHNSDSENVSGLTPKEICNSESFKSGAKGSVYSNMHKAKSPGYIKSTKEDKEDFSVATDCLKPVAEVFDECGMIRKYYGVRSEVKQKTIILLGASGSGKTTLVNFVANYYRGVKTADGELVHVVRNSNDVRSYTTSITAYTFCSGEHETPITVIDTPGLNDSSGAEVRDHVQSLKTFLVNAASQNYEIHAIGFVAQAHLVRLTSSERLVMDYVSTLFGQSVENHFFTFVTFADSQETPPVVEAMKNYGVKCNTFLKFNNSALSNIKTDVIDDLDRVYWRIGNKSWKKCMKSLHNLSALSVGTLKTLMNEVFAATVIDSAERELKAEMKEFIARLKESKYLTKDSILSCEKVWESAALVHHLKSTRASDSSDDERILVNFAEIVCKENGVQHDSYIQLLSLAPSRQLLNAGIGVIQSIEHLYWQTVGILDERRKTFSKPIKKFLYCHECDADHELGRINPHFTIRVPFFGLNSVYNSYVCLNCKCDGNLHGQRQNDGDSSETSHSNTFDFNKLFQHTVNCLTSVIEEFSISGYLVNLYVYLQHINDATNGKYDKFIRALITKLKYM